MFNECRHIKPSGAKCQSPALRGMPCCFFHTNLNHSKKPKGKYDDWSLKLPSLEDNCGIQIALAEVLEALASGRLDPRRAGLLLYGIQIAAKIAARSSGPHINTVRDMGEETEGAFLGLEKTACEPPQDCRSCPKADWCEDYEEPDEYEEDENEQEQSALQSDAKPCADEEPKALPVSSHAALLNKLLACHEDGCDRAVRCDPQIKDLTRLPVRKIVRRQRPGAALAYLLHADTRSVPKPRRP